MTVEDQLRLAWAMLYPHDDWVDAEFAARLVTGYLRRLKKAHGTLRDEREIVEAHDTLRAVLTNPALEQSIVPDETDYFKATCFLDTLCWLLSHDHNRSFETWMTLIRERLLANGIQMKERT